MGIYQYFSAHIDFFGLISILFGLYLLYEIVTKDFLVNLKKTIATLLH